MKKFTLLMTLITSFYFQSKAQDQSLADAGYKTAFTSDLTSGNKPIAKSTHNFFNDDSVPVVKDYNYYIKKSKGQRTGGLVLLGTGVLASGLGLLVAASSNASLDDAQTGVIIMGIGVVCGIISIPVMVSAHKNKNKAKLMLSNQKTGYGIPVEKFKNVTGLSLSIPIGK